MSKYTLNSTTPETPFYYYDLTLLRETLQTVVSEARKYDYHVHYAMKANVEPRILAEIQKAGLGADCVSGYEVRQAIENGFSPDTVVFAGVGKSDKEIRYAISQDIFAFNCESLQELEVVNELATEQGKTVRIALRINPDVQPDTHKYISTGQGESKFGISYAETERALAKLDRLANLRIVGIHFHIGSQILNLDSFRALAVRVNEIAEWFTVRNIGLEFLNVGGGLGIDYENPDQNPIPDFAGYFSLFHELLKTNGLPVHFELGRSIVGQCGELITRVLYTKTAGEEVRFAITDASMTELIRPALYKARHKIENLTAEAQGRSKEKYYIAGPICESSDFFARGIEFPKSERGDIITIRSTGAYGSVMASHYNMRPTAPSYFSDDMQ